MKTYLLIAKFKNEETNKDENYVCTFNSREDCVAYAKAALEEFAFEVTFTEKTELTTLDLSCDILENSYYEQIARI